MFSAGSIKLRVKKVCVKIVQIKLGLRRVLLLTFQSSFQNGKKCSIKTGRSISADNYHGMVLGYFFSFYAV